MWALALVSALTYNSADSLLITVSDSGTGAIIREGEALVQIRPNVAAVNWRGVGPSSVTATENGSEFVFLIDGVSVPGTLERENTDQGVRVRFSLFPNTTVPIEQASLQLEIESGLYAGTPIGLNGGTFLLPPDPSDPVHVYTGPLRAVDLPVSDPPVLVRASAEDQPGLIQDSRRWSGPFEFRFILAEDELVGGESYSTELFFSNPSGLTLVPNEPFILEASEEWIPLEFPLDVQEGSLLDRSPRSIRPAGSRGHLIVGESGHFEFEQEPGVRQIFYGPNLCFSSMFMDHEDSDRLARRLRMMGYNTVRFHHYDRDLILGVEASPDDSTQMNPEALDRLHYFFAALKREGIYVKIDLFSLRQIREDEIIPGPVGMDEYKALLLFHEPARQNWLEFTRNFLTAENPYTGMTLAEDPALAWICVVNENNMGSATISLGPVSQQLLDELYQEAGGEGSFNRENESAAAFGAQLHVEAFRWMRDQLREMGTQALLTDVNGWHEQRGLILTRDELDFVDNHFYWDHPSFLGQSWGLPSRGASGGGISVRQGGGGLQTMALTRLEGKPFTVSEFNFSNPNRFRAEGGLVFGAIAARQDWDGAWRFAWTHSADSVLAPQPTTYFDMQNDPLMMATDRAIVDLFLRGDLDPAGPSALLLVDPLERPQSGYDAPMRSQILDRRFFSSTSRGGDGNEPEPEGRRPAWMDANAGAIYVNTAMTVGVFGPTDERLEVGPLNVEFSGHRAALWLSSRDGMPVRESSSMLLTHLTDLQNTGMRFSALDRQVLEAWGDVPHLVRAGAAEISLEVTNPAEVRVFRLDLAGNRISSVPVQVEGNQVRFVIGNSAEEAATFYYEVTRD